MKKFFLIPLMTLVCSVMAWATDVAQIGTTKYASLQAAIEAADDGATIELIAKIGTDNPEYSIPAIAKKLYIKKWKATSSNNKYKITAGEGYRKDSTKYGISIMPEGSAALDLYDYLTGGSTEVYDVTSNIDMSCMTNIAVNGTKTLNISDGVTISNCNANYMFTLESGDNLTILGNGTISGANNYEYLFYVDAGSLIIGSEGSTNTPKISNTGKAYAIYVYYGASLDIKRANITATGGNAVYLNKTKTASTISINNATITSDRYAFYWEQASSTTNVTISNSTLTSTNTSTDFSCVGFNSNVNLSNLTFNNCAISSSTPYAINASKVNLVIDGDESVVEGKLSAIYLQNSANCVINDGTFTATNSGVNSVKTIYLRGGGAVTINGGTINATHTGGEDASALQITEASTATINGGTINATSNRVGVAAYIQDSNSTLNVAGGALTGNIYGISGNGSEGIGGTTINISGGTISATNGAGIYQPQSGTLTISGGVITGSAAGVAMKAGSLTMTDGQVIANGPENRVPGCNNGIVASGAALQIESNDAYAGNMQIAISGGDLESSNGYAIYEYVAKSGDDTHVNTIAVTNGNFQGGICGSQSLSSKGGYVSGGKWSVDVTANVVKGKAANPIDQDPYFFEVGDPTPATAEIVNDPSKNAVLTNEDGETYAGSYTSEAVGDDAEVKTPAATNQVVISKNTDVVVDNSDENNSTIVEVKKVTVEGDAQLNVKEGATLMVGAGSVLLDENTATGGLTVEAGAALVVEGLVYGSTEENFVIKGEEDKSGIVLFSPETEFVREDHPKATYRFKSKSFKDGSKWVYQRFGMPSVDGNVTVKEADGTPSTVRSFICTWDYATDDWSSWAELDKTNGLVYTDAVPFQCYQLGSDNIKDAPVTYDFIVELMGNANAPLNFKAGWNPYANSYTAPIDIKEFLTDVIANSGSDILATIYLYKDLGNDTYTWQGINLSNVGKTYRVRENGAMVKKTYDASIEPMQAFIMKLSSGEDATTDINYLNNVYNPAMGIDRPASAPARSRVSYNEMQIGAYNDMYWDNISVMEGEQFSAAEDNGYDAPKYDHNKGLSLYVINGEQHMERVATDNADGMFIGINAPVAGTYTLDFSGIVGMNYSIMDMTNNTLVTIEEDGQFNFYAEAGQNDYRFQLVAPARVPTAVENVGAKADVKGVYTITGQYLGEDINALPKGVYIINGAKVVK